MNGKKYNVCPNPCSTCPYRKDVPSGIWSRQEYDKLPLWDQPFEGMGIVFLCHNHAVDTTGNMLCRGWLEVHEANIGVRLLGAMKINWNDRNLQPTKIPLYASGAEARAAGIKGIRRPSRKAREAADKVLKSRLRKIMPDIKF